MGFLMSDIRKEYGLASAEKQSMLYLLLRIRLR